MYFVDLQVCKYHWENPPEMCLHCFKPSTESGKTVTRAQSVMLSPLLMRSACVTSLATSPLCYHLPRMEKKAVCGMTGWRKAGCYWQDIRVQLQGTSCRHPRRSGAHCARSLLRATLPTKCGKHIQSCMRHNFASLAQPHSWSTVSSHPHFLKCDWALLVIPGELCFWPSRLSHPHRRLMFLRLFCIEDSDLNKVKKLDCTISTECQRRGGEKKAELSSGHYSLHSQGLSVCSTLASLCFKGHSYVQTPLSLARRATLWLGSFQNFFLCVIVKSDTGTVSSSPKTLRHCLLLIPSSLQGMVCMEDSMFSCLLSAQKHKQQFMGIV